MSGIFGGNVLGSRGLGDDVYPEDEYASGSGTRVSDEESGTRDETLTKLLNAAEGQACTSKAAISYVQAIIGTNIDGAWGPNSQAALNKTGKSFKSFLPSCSGNAPSYSSGGTSVSTPATTTSDPDKIAAPQQAGFADIFKKIPPIGWVGLLAIGAVVILGRKKKGK